MYCSAFRRLAGVTQVASPGTSFIFHTRLTHTLEVAQIAKRIAENILSASTGTSLERDVNPDVVETAALIHDLGHPPFGHVAEDELNTLLKVVGESDGFEGNAQSFRIVTRLAAHRTGYAGLDLCRATLNASLKYPWTASDGDLVAEHHGKFGAYSDDEGAFSFAREGCERGITTLEAEIMDFSDDVAYSVHDMDDFYRAGLLPLDRLAHDREEIDTFVENWKADKKYAAPDDLDEYLDGIKYLLGLICVADRYDGSFEQRATIRAGTSQFIKTYVEHVKADGDDDWSLHLNVDRKRRVEIDFFKRVVREYVISNSRLATQQYGQRNIIKTLFTTILESLKGGHDDLVPGRFRHVLEQFDRDRETSYARLVADIVSSFTDLQATTLANRIMGHDLGRLSDLVMP